ncbi:TIGR01777 family oxidoreductase [Silvibacterium sp.]|uniref:TIGR01777 family oxidoreductase n=1 Tax=Silvibacterium sp. TaxID=1964179 RepID=UPI0039E576CB
MTPLRIVIAGGSGQVGQMLARYFHAQGHKVTVLSRRPASTLWRVVLWDESPNSAWVRELEGCDVLINLAGRSVNCRYTEENRRAIYDSRINTTRLLNEVVSHLVNPPKVWLNASTATIYRHALDRDMNEITGELGGGESGAPDNWNFSIKVAKDWETVFFATITPQTRKVAMRSAITLSPDRGSVFEVLLKLVRCGLGGAIGSGNQYVSWVHEADFIRAVEWLIDHEDVEGPVNLTAPNPVPNRAFMRAFRDSWGARVGLPAAGWMIEVGCFLMRTESELVLKSRRVVPGRLLDAGFQFEFPEWPAAVRELVKRWRTSH